MTQSTGSKQAHRALIQRVRRVLGASGSTSLNSWGQQLWQAGIPNRVIELPDHWWEQETAIDSGLWLSSKNNHESEGWIVRQSSEAHKHQVLPLHNTTSAAIPSVEALDLKVLSIWPLVTLLPGLWNPRLQPLLLSVLEAGTLTRYEGQPGRFRFQVPRLQFFNVWVEPVVDVYVRVPEADDETPEVLLRSEGCYMYGSPAFDKLRLNDKFHMEFETRVRARTSGRPTFADDEDGETWSANGEIEGGRGELLARSEINVACEVVAPFHLVPRRALEKTCSAVLNGLIKLLLPTFVAQLRDDFGIWATHPEARKARVEKAEREYGKT